MVVNTAEESELDAGNGKLVCAGKPIVIQSHCTLEASPQNITFDNRSVRGTPGTLEDVKTTNVTVRCRSGADISKKPANIRIYTQHTDESDPALARFENRNGEIFRGVGLVYNLNERPECAGSNKRLVWNTPQKLGEWQDVSSGKASSGTVYWGLCRLPDSNPDTGEYRTTATISFWVD